MIKQADENDIPAIEQILSDAVLWMRKNQLQNQWTEESIKWSSLSKDYRIDDFYIDLENGIPAGCMAVTDLDLKYWPQIPCGQSLYIHKLAVKRMFAGKGISRKLIDSDKNLALTNSIDSLRLDCNLQRRKLMTLYENEGFKSVGSKNLGNDCCMELYVWYSIIKNNVIY